VLWSQLAKATNNLNISVNLLFACSPSLSLAHNTVALPLASHIAPAIGNLSHTCKGRNLHANKDGCDP